MLPGQVILSQDEQFLEYSAEDIDKPRENVESRVRDYVSLLKPRVMSLVVFTGAVGLYIAPGHIHPLIAIVTILCIALGSGAAGAINMWFDRDIDLIMERTKRRPIPRGVIHPDDALQFGILLSVFSVLIISIAVNLLSAFLLAIAILFYIFVYTIWLKRKTVQNIVIGGAAGAIPPMIGWAAVTNNVTIEPILLFMIIFFWTPPHFWALALYKADDYKKANIPMLPVAKGETYTKKQIVLYTVILTIISFLPLFYFANTLYLVSIILLNIIFLYYALMVYREKEYYYAKKLFRFSIFYLFMTFFIMFIEVIYYNQL